MPRYVADATPLLFAVAADVSMLLRSMPLFQLHYAAAAEMPPLPHCRRRLRHAAIAAFAITLMLMPHFRCFVFRQLLAADAMPPLRHAAFLMPLRDKCLPAADAIFVAYADIEIPPHVFYTCFAGFRYCHSCHAAAYDADAFIAILPMLLYFRYGCRQPPPSSPLSALIFCRRFADILFDVFRCH